MVSPVPEPAAIVQASVPSVLVMSVLAHTSVGQFRLTSVEEDANMTAFQAS